MLHPSIPPVIDLNLVRQSFTIPWVLLSHVMPSRQEYCAQEVDVAVSQVDLFANILFATNQSLIVETGNKWDPQISSKWKDRLKRKYQTVHQ